MARILRGEVRWANLNPTLGHEQSGMRPVLILSNDVFNERMQIEILGIDGSDPHPVGGTDRETAWFGKSRADGSNCGGPKRNYRHLTKG